jgi:hypothetical protein
MLKRSQILLEDWQEKFIKKTFKHISFSMAVRLIICVYILLKKTWKGGQGISSMRIEDYDDINFEARKEINNVSRHNKKRH